MAKITKRLVDKLPPPDKQKDIFVWDQGDGSLKGFGIRIKPSGVSSYLIQYRNQEGRTRRLVIGRVGTLTPDEARSEARNKLAAVDKGGDPSAERHAIRSSIKVSELCDLYLKDAKGRIKPSTLAVDKMRIDVHVKPLLGNRAVTGLSTADITQFQNDIANGKTAKPRKEKGRGGHPKGGPGAASRTVDMLGSILELAVRHSLIPKNPVRGVRKIPKGKKERFLSHDEIRALGIAMKEAEPLSRTAIAAIRLLLLTGCRKNEVLALPWQWVDFENSCIRFGDTKTGAQLRSIGKAAVKCLQEIPRKEKVDWVFPAMRGDGHFVGLPKVLGRLYEAAEIKNASLHTLRHTFASIAAELNFSELTIAGIMGHKVPGITARYAHMPDRALVSAADQVADYISSLLGGEK